MDQLANDRSFFIFALSLYILLLQLLLFLLFVNYIPYIFQRKNLHYTIAIKSNENNYHIIIVTNEVNIHKSVPTCYKLFFRFIQSTHKSISMNF